MDKHPLRKAREAQGLSIALLAEKTQVGASTIRRIETGGPAGWYTQRQLSSYFGVSPKELGLLRSSAMEPVENTQG